MNPNDTAPASALHSEYFDGHQPLPHAVRLWVADAELVIQGEGFVRRVPCRAVRWPERQRHGVRLAYLPDQGLISHADGPAWDAWAAGQGLRDPLVVRWMQSWRGVIAALLLCMAGAVVIWIWGVPWAGRVALALLPTSVDERVGEQALAAIDRRGLLPSRLPPERQAALRDALARSLERGDPAAPRPAWRLHFRASGHLNLGPNAFALPGGQVVLTDELVELLADQPDVIIGVLGHELAHVRHRHGMRMVVQAGLLGALTGWVLGDFSTLLATVPAVLGQQSYARDFEREADDEAIRLLRANGISPGCMSLLFERLATWRREHGQDEHSVLPIALADHPADDERMRRFEDADRQHP